MPFSFYTMGWLGEHWSSVVEEFIQNGGSPMMQRAFRTCFMLGRRDPVPDKKKKFLEMQFFMNMSFCVNQEMS
jgi:hypothetical protein